MKQLSGIDKQCLEASKPDRTWNDDDDECHLAENKTWDCHH